MVYINVNGVECVECHDKVEQYQLRYDEYNFPHKICLKCIVKPTD